MGTPTIKEFLILFFCVLLMGIILVCFAAIMADRGSKDFEDRACVFGVIATLCAIAFILAIIAL